MTTNLNASPKKSIIPRVTFNNNDMNYKDRASTLFQKLNSFKTSLQNQKYSKHADLIVQLQNLQKIIQSTSAQKESSIANIVLLLAKIEEEIKSQNHEFQRYKKLLDNTVDNCNRECRQVFDKMTKDRISGQNSISKYVDFKIESFMLKNKGVWTQQDMFNFQPYKDQLNYLKKEVEQFYKNQQKEELKLQKQVTQNLQRQKQFLLAETRRTDTEDLMKVIETIYVHVTAKVKKMAEKRQNMEQNIFSMIENVISSYIKDMNKFK